VGHLHTCRSTVGQNDERDCGLRNLGHKKAKNRKVQSIENLKGKRESPGGITFESQRKSKGKTGRKYGKNKQ
jgi:hypothetical protein